MESENNYSSTKTLLASQEEGVNLTKFRKKNKILILISVSLIISLTIIISALITYLMKNTTFQPDEPLVNPAVEAFCLVSNDTPSCLSTFNPVISPKSKTDPNQIFTLSLQTSHKELEYAISFLSSSSSTSNNIVAFTNCSVSLRNGLSRISDALAAVRVNAFVDMPSDEQWVEVMNWIHAAGEDLMFCLDDLDGAGESTAVSAAIAKVRGVKEYVDYSEEFLSGYGQALQIYGSGVPADRGLDLEILFGMCMCGLQVVFMFFLFRALFWTR